MTQLTTVDSNENVNFMVNLKHKFLRIFFATDVHGSTIVFKKFLNAGITYAADVLVLGGDVTGKLIVPIVKGESGVYNADFMEQNWMVKSEELDTFRLRVENSGSYPYITTKQEWDVKGRPPEYDKLYEQLAEGRIREWILLAEAKFKGNVGSIYLTGGNDDPAWFKSILSKNEWIRDIDEELVELPADYQMVSMGYGNRTPWKTPREMDENQLTAKINDMVAKCSAPMDKCIFNFHIPPYNSGLDTCPKVDGSFNPPKYVFESGQPVMIGAGSTAVRKAIEEYQPVLGLHGHVHEQRGAVKIGKTLCINPGSEYGEGVLRGVILNLDLKEKGVLSHQFTGG